MLLLLQMVSLTSTASPPRYAEATGPGVRFRDNSLEQIDDDDVAAASSNSSFKVKMGPASSGDKGKNVLKVWDTDVKFIENDEPGSDVLNARNNYWYLQHSGGEEFLSDPPPQNEDENAEIDARCLTSSGASADATTDVSNHKPMESGIQICAFRHEDAPASARIAGSGESPAGREAVVRLEGSVPLETKLGRAYPNPTSGGVTVPFALSPEGEGAVRVDVFDVRGRRVRTLLSGRLPAARYELSWPGVDQSGGRVSPGIYFVRFNAGGDVQTSKITMLR